MKITLEDLEKEKDPKKLAEEAERAKEAAERDRNWEDTKGVGQKFKEEKKKFQQMDRKEKLSYFRSYYLLPCVIILIAGIITVSIIRDVIKGQGEVLISGMLLNTSLSDEGQQYVEDGYIEYLGRTGEKVHVNTAQYVIDYSNNMAMSASYQTQMAVVTQLAAGTLDFVLVDDSAFEYLGSHALMFDPSQVLTQETYEKYQDRMEVREVEKFVAEDEETVTEPVTDSGTGEAYEDMSEGTGTGEMVQIAGYKIAGTKLGEYLNWPDADHTYLILVSREENSERVGNFLDYLFEG